MTWQVYLITAMTMNSYVRHALEPYCGWIDFSHIAIQCNHPSRATISYPSHQSHQDAVLEEFFGKLASCRHVVGPEEPQEHLPSHEVSLKAVTPIERAERDRSDCQGAPW